MAKRPYTGNKDGAAKGLRPGMKVFIEEVIKLGNGALWNNGDWGVRTMRGKESLSVHATGRAVDLSYRHIPEKKKGKKKGRPDAIRVLKILQANAELLGLEAMFDYFPKPWGRAWMCSRDAWARYRSETIHGAPGGDWIHLEVSPEMASDPKKMREAFQKLVIPNGLMKAE